MMEQSATDEQYKALVKATSDVIYRLSADWEVMYQLDGRGFLKSTSAPITGWREINVHALDLEVVNANIKEAIATKTMFELEHRVNRADGSTGWTVSRAVPILDSDGTILEWFGTASDISLRKDAEAELQAAKDEAVRQQQVYENVTANTPDLVYVFELDYTFSYANKALLEMWGKTWDEAVGKSLLENGYEPWHAQMHEREIDHIVATGERVRGEVEFPHAVLGRRVYDYILVPVFDASGKVTAVSGVTRDVTERKMDEIRKNDFIGMVSHELKTPLTALSGTVQLMERKAQKAEDEFFLTAAGNALRQVKKMSGMINGFLNISRLESGKIVLDKTAFDLSELIREVIADTIELDSSHQIGFEDTGTTSVNADRGKIGSVLSNILSNAVKYSPIGSAITVRCATGGNKVKVSIADQGCGLQPNDLEKIFQRYYRVTENVNVSGFGIGLYLSAEIIDRHSGRIWAESEVGTGSTFHFELPLD